MQIPMRCNSPSSLNVRGCFEVLCNMASAQRGWTACLDTLAVALFFKRFTIPYAERYQ